MAGAMHEPITEARGRDDRSRRIVRFPASHACPTVHTLPQQRPGIFNHARDGVRLGCRVIRSNLGVTVDQHFLRRRRHNRLISVVLEHPTIVGVGIDESTALIVSADAPWEIIGASQATVYDARRSSITPTGKTLGASNVQEHVLPAGSRFDLATARATLP